MFRKKQPFIVGMIRNTEIHSADKNEELPSVPASHTGVVSSTVRCVHN